MCRCHESVTLGIWNVSTPPKFKQHHSDVCTVLSIIIRTVSCTLSFELWRTMITFDISVESANCRPRLWHLFNLAKMFYFDWWKLCSRFKLPINSVHVFAVTLANTFELLLLLIMAAAIGLQSITNLISITADFARKLSDRSRQKFRCYKGYPRGC